MNLFSFLSFHFMCVTVTVVTGHSVALSRRSHLFSTMSSLHDVLVHDNFVDKYRVALALEFGDAIHDPKFLYTTTMFDLFNRYRCKVY
jgi:hypothetical protein